MHSMDLCHSTRYDDLLIKILKGQLLLATDDAPVRQQNRGCLANLNNVTTDKHGKAFCILGVAGCVSMCRPHRLYEIYYVLLYGVNKRNLLLSHSCTLGDFLCLLLAAMCRVEGSGAEEDVAVIKRDKSFCQSPTKLNLKY